MSKLGHLCLSNWIYSAEYIFNFFLTPQFSVSVLVIQEVGAAENGPGDISMWFATFLLEGMRRA